MLEIRLHDFDVAIDRAHFDFRFRWTVNHHVDLGHVVPPPIFLLDDADAEWDDVRLRAVLHSLAASPGQLLLTAKRAEVVKLLPAEPAVFHIQNGKISG